MSLILAMCLFSLSMSISPGPVNMISLSIGLNRGFRYALPFVSGSTTGFTLMLAIVGMGLGRVVSASPMVFNIITLGGVGFILYLGYKTAFSRSKINPVLIDLPGFNKGFLLQWLNPKAWSACLAGVSGFHLINTPKLLAVFCGLYFIICLCSIASWALAGEKMKQLFKNPGHLHFFNLALGIGLIMVAHYLLYIHVWA